MPLTEWVSNPIPITKKQGTVHICIDYRDLNKDCPKENNPTPFIDQIIYDCANCEVLSFMGNFFDYIQIKIVLENQHKIDFIFP